MESVRFNLSREDWSLHRQGEIDQRRHQEKVKEALRRNLADLVSDESIISASGDKVIKIPIRTLEEFRFRFSYGKQDLPGQGEGNTPAGKILGSDLKPGNPAGRGAAGEAPGIDCYEAEITVDELEELIFADLGLPNLKNRSAGEITREDIQFNDVRKKGIQSNLDKKRTLLENLKRNAREGRPELKGINPEDLRYKVWEQCSKPQAQAVVLAMMDTSGSMGKNEKYLARSFFYWMVRFLRTRYQQVQIRFLAHDVTAREVAEEQFFTRVESGGTRCSSVYQLALELIDKDYSDGSHQIYAFHFSDGENLVSDNDLCVELARNLLERCNLLGYGEIGPDPDDMANYWDIYGMVPLYDSRYTLRQEFERIRHPGFISTTINDKASVYRALKLFFKLPEEA